MATKRSTSGAKYLSNKNKFNGEEFTDFEFKKGRALTKNERKAMKQRLAEAQALKNAPKEPVTAGIVEYKKVY